MQHSAARPPRGQQFKEILHVDETVFIEVFAAAHHAARTPRGHDGHHVIEVDSAGHDRVGRTTRCAIDVKAKHGAGVENGIGLGAGGSDGEYSADHGDSLAHVPTGVADRVFQFDKLIPLARTGQTEEVGSARECAIEVGEADARCKQFAIEGKLSPK